MAAEKGSSLKKKSREDLLLMIRELVEENEALRRQLAEAKAEEAPKAGAEEAETVKTEQKTQLMTSLDSLRASVDACTDAILALNKNRAENE